MAKGTNVTILNSDSGEHSAEEEQTPPKATPLPFKQMTALSLVLITESVGTSMLLPFVPDFVVYLQNYSSTNEAGKVTGILVGLFMLGQVVSSKLWGYLSDVYGRRFPMIVGLFVGAWAMLFFGLAPNIYVCCVLRFVHGFFNGNVLVAKTMIADITDKTNEAKGFALVSITWGAGSLFGPAIGGFLYNPAHSSTFAWMGISQDGFLARHPAFLPSFVIFIYTMTALTITVIVLKETNPNRKPLTSSRPVQFLAKFVPFLKKYRKDTVAEEAHDIAVVSSPEPVASVKRDVRSTAAVDGNEDSGDRTSPEDDDQTFCHSRAVESTLAAAQSSANPNVKMDNETEEMVVVEPTPAPQPAVRKNITYMQAMHIAPIRNITIFYVLLAASDMTYSQVLPLWSVAERSVNGLEYKPQSISIILVICGVPSVVSNLFFSQMCILLKINYIRFWMLAMVLYNISTVMTPVGSVFQYYAGLVYIIAAGSVRQVGLSWGYSLIHMLTAKSAPLGCVGAVYGISQSYASMTRCLIPFIVSPLFAWSVQPGRVFPFNYCLLFLFAVACTVIATILSFFLRIERNAEDDEMDAQIIAEQQEEEQLANSITSMDRVSSRGGRRGFGSRTSSIAGDRDDEDDDEEGTGVQGAYFALVASFCTNPVSDAYMPLSQLEKANEEAHAAIELQRRAEASATGGAERDSDHDSVEEVVITPHHNAPREGDEMPPYTEVGDSPITLSLGNDDADRAVRNQYTIRARTAGLLESLKAQQVESSRLAGGAADAAQAGAEEDEELMFDDDVDQPKRDGSQDTE